jgi:predicted transcriptional regulator
MSKKTEKLESLGELELAVMRVLWDRPESTVQEVAGVISQRRNCARTTILTVMQRLHTKKFLKRRKKNGVFHYTPSRERGVVMNGLVESFVDIMLDGSTLPILSYLTKTNQLTEEQSVELQRILDAMESSSKEQ